MSERLLPLMVIIVLAWIMVFLGSYIIFEIIVPLPDFFAGREGLIFTSIVKSFLATILVVIWILVLYQLTNLHVKKKIIGTV